jgi:hypothetical protein
MGGVALVLCTTAAPRSARSDVCDPGCDVDCSTCCKKWTIRAACPGREALETGSYPTPREAAAGALSASPAATDRCEDGTAPRWQPYCAPENAVASPVDPPAMTKLVAVRASLGQRLHDVRDAQGALFDFAEKRFATTAGQQRLGEAAAAFRQVRAAVVDAMATSQQLVARAEMTQADVDALDASTSDVRQRADVAVAKARALMGDPTIIDFAAEARQKKISEALAAIQARQAAEKARGEDARRQVEEAEERRRAALEETERERQAAVAQGEQRRQEAQQRAKEEEERKRMAVAAEAQRKIAAAAAEQGRKADAARTAELQHQQEAASLYQGLHDSTIGQARADLALCSDTIANLTMMDMQAGMSPEMKTRALSLRQSLENEKDKLRDVLTGAIATKDKQPISAAYSALQAIHKEGEAAHKETADLVNATKSIRP